MSFLDRIYCTLLTSVAYNVFGMGMILLEAHCRKPDLDNENSSIELKERVGISSVGRSAGYSRI
jgi:hypothetical protein